MSGAVTRERKSVRGFVSNDIHGTTESRDSKDITGIEAFIVHKDGDIRPLVNALGSVCKGLVRSDVVLLVTSDLVVGNGIFSRNPLDGAADSPLLRHTKCHRVYAEIVDGNRHVTIFRVTL